MDTVDRLTWEYQRGRISKELYDERVRSYYTSKLLSNCRKAPVVLGIVNISKVPDSVEWFIDPRVADNKVSPAEEMIGKILNGYDVEFYREVSFMGLRLATFGYPRYDFFIPSLWLCIEYDGKLSHESEEQKQKDELKNKFCQDNKIHIVRYSNKHYYNMELHIESLMKQYGIKKRKGS